jgi:lipoprotein-anchoring transpeptidase ErfK/SrfK
MSVVVIVIADGSDGVSATQRASHFPSGIGGQRWSAASILGCQDRPCCWLDDTRFATEPVSVVVIKAQFRLTLSRPSDSERWKMKSGRIFPSIFSIAIGFMLAISASGERAGAQPDRTLEIDDQPGVVPDPRDEQLPAAFRRQAVFYRTNEPAGTIVIDTADRYLYLIQGNNRALRYGIGVGREGFQWQGLLRVSRKSEWPDWTPPPEMIQRQPYLPRFMAGGPGNPMGARALYLGATVYRIHGTNQPQTIGSAVSSGCFRLANNDVMDLYERIPVGTKVVVRQRPIL